MVKAVAKLACLVPLFAACGAPELTYRSDSSSDAGADVLVEASIDAAMDGTVDAIEDAAEDGILPDGPEDALHEAPFDAQEDVPTDAQEDVPTDAPTDAQEDVPTDAQEDVPTDAQEDVPTDAQEDAPTDAPTDAPEDHAEASVACSPGMVQVPRGDGSFFCIDTTEVTQHAYAQWLATAPDPSSQGVPCLGNGVYEPEASCGSYTPGATPGRPVTCVDWCDAVAYCAAAGKRLCGGLGGGAAPYNQSHDPSSSEWMRACSAEGTSQFPYGDTFEASTCNGVAYGAGMPVNVGLVAGCEGGMPGLRDMSGNVAEWENSCGDTTAVGSCRVRGGSYLDVMNGLRCRAATDVARNEARAHVGFRCCRDVP